MHGPQTANEQTTVVHIVCLNLVNVNSRNFLQISDYVDKIINYVFTLRAQEGLLHCIA